MGKDGEGGGEGMGHGGNENLDESKATFCRFSELSFPTNQLHVSQYVTNLEGLAACPSSHCTMSD